MKELKDYDVTANIPEEINENEAHLTHVVMITSKPNMKTMEFEHNTRVVHFTDEALEASKDTLQRTEGTLAILHSGEKYKIEQGEKAKAEKEAAAAKEKEDKEKADKDAAEKDKAKDDYIAKLEAQLKDKAKADTAAPAKAAKAEEAAAAKATPEPEKGKAEDPAEKK